MLQVALDYILGDGLVQKQRDSVEEHFFLERAVDVGSDFEPVVAMLILCVD